MRTVEPPKVVQNAGVLYIFTCKCAWRHSGVPFFHIWTSKSGPRMLCFVHFWLWNVLLATVACHFSTSDELQKVVRECCVLYILTWKCASRYSGVQFFDIWTSKNGPRMLCFVHFDLEMCFSLQRRAIFRHRNFKKWSVPEVFCTFWLGNVLLATAALQFFHIATSKSGPNMQCFAHFDFKMCFAPQRRAIFHFSAQQLPPHPPLSEPTFRPSPPTNHWKNTACRDFPNISRLLIFFLLTFNCPYCRKLDF